MSRAPCGTVKSALTTVNARPEEAAPARRGLRAPVRVALADLGAAVRVARSVGRAPAAVRVAAAALGPAAVGVAARLADRHLVLRRAHDLRSDPTARAPVRAALADVAA